MILNSSIMQTNFSPRNLTDQASDVDKAHDKVVIHENQNVIMPKPDTISSINNQELDLVAN